MTHKPGPENLITDVNGLTVGNATDEKAGTGVTVLRVATPNVAAADLRGGAPGTRETDVLMAENLVQHVDAIALSGGSVFGLAAADGVTSYLSQEDVGLRLVETSPAIPIVPGAVLHDLGNDGDKNWGDHPPYRQLGIGAAKTAAKDFTLGSVGAGRGAMAGAVKGGLGSASVSYSSEIMVGALAAVNPVGSVYFPDGKSFYAAPWEQDDEFGGMRPKWQKDDPAPFPPFSRFGKPRENTTLAIVATNATLTRAEAKRVAIMAQDGIARAIRPAHTPFDGDIIFALSTCEVTLGDDAMARAFTVAQIGSLAADALTRSIARAVYEARKTS